MGWNYSHIRCTPREELLRVVEREHYVSLDKAGKVVDRFPSPYRILDLAIVALSEAYMAVEDTRDGKVRAWTYLVKMGPKSSRFNFGYKDMDESMEPCMYRCPERILNRLSPVDEAYSDQKMRDWANIWRERNRLAIGRRQAAHALKDGDRIRLLEPIRFQDGKVRDTFTVSKSPRHPRRFVDDSGAVCNIGSFDTLAFDLLSA